MSLSSLIDKAKTTTKKWWKWMLGVAIALVVLFVVWRIRSQAKKIAALEAQQAAQKELIKDLEVRAANEKDAAAAKVLQGEVTKLKEDMDQRDVELQKMKNENTEAQKVVDKAKTWDELEKAARGTPK